MFWLLFCNTLMFSFICSGSNKKNFSSWHLLSHVPMSELNLTDHRACHISGIRAAVAVWLFKTVSQDDTPAFQNLKNNHNNNSRGVLHSLLETCCDLTLQQSFCGRSVEVLEWIECTHWQCSFSWALKNSVNCDRPLKCEEGSLLKYWGVWDKRKNPCVLTNLKNQTP